MPIFKKIWVKVEASDHEDGRLPYDVRVENVIADFQSEVRAFYGHFDLLDVGDVPLEIMRYWSVERVKIIGRAPQKKLPDRPEGEVDMEDETSEPEQGDEEELRRCYCNRPGVKELERRIKRWNVTNMSDPDSRQRHDLARAMSLATPGLDNNHWRISLTLREEYEGAGRSAKRLVVREEIWVGVQIGW